MLKIITIILVCLIILSGLTYAIGTKILKNKYETGFNLCMSQKDRIIQETQYQNKISEKVKDCFDKGGCYNTCGSGCNPLKKPPYGFSDFIPKSTICTANCVASCLEPIK